MRSGYRLDPCKSGHKLTAFVPLAGRDLDIDDDTGLVADRRVLLVGGLQPPGAAARGHGGLRIGKTDLLDLATRCSGIALSARPAVIERLVLRLHGLDPAPCQGVPAHVSADERGIDMNHLAGGDPGLDTSPDAALEDAPEALCTPALPNAGE